LTGEDLKYYEFDVFLPFLSLALEYQGETHYVQTNTFGSPEARQQADKKKVRYASKAGITLIPIPFWWDKSIPSLVATIKNYRPDLIDSDMVPAKASPIPSSLPAKLPPQLKAKPRGAQEYNDSVDPTGW
jgi:hypothetical protein